MVEIKEVGSDSTENSVNGASNDGSVIQQSNGEVSLIGTIHNC